MTTRIIENKLINLNSQNATLLNGDFHSSILFSFVGILTDDPTVKNVSISIQNAQFPFSFYNINVYNNLLKLSVDANPPITLTFTRGNYNATSLISEIQTQLTNAGISDITLSISSITGIVTWTKTSGSFTIFSSGSSCFKILGFAIGTDYTSTASVLVPPYPLNLLGTLKLRIASSKLAINTIDSSVDGNLNILSSIPINAGNFGLITYENTNNIQNQLNLRVLDGFDLEIIDDDQNLINFNGCHYTITMLLSIEREVLIPGSSTFNDITKKAILAFAEANQELPEPEPNANPEVNTDVIPEDSIPLGDYEAPDLEETIIPDDLDLLLYSKGIR